MTRILALHGFRTSGKIMKLQTSRMARLIGCEIIAINAFHKASGPPHPEVAKWFGADGPFYEHYNAIEDDDGKFTYVGVEESLSYLHKTIEEKVRLILHRFFKVQFITILLALKMKIKSYLFGLPCYLWNISKMQNSNF